MGVIESDPELMRSTDGSPACQFVLAAEAQVFTVMVSSQHAQWIASTISAGLLVRVTGAMVQDGGHRLIHAAQVTPADEPTD